MIVAFNVAIRRPFQNLGFELGCPEIPDFTGF